jgi:hypothetical protein
MEPHALGAAYEACLLAIDMSSACIHQPEYTSINLACRDRARPFVLKPWRPSEEGSAPVVLERRGRYAPELGWTLCLELTRPTVGVTSGSCRLPLFPPSYSTCAESPSVFKPNFHPHSSLSLQVETLRAYAKKGAESLQQRTDGCFTAQLTEVLTTARLVNKTDVRYSPSCSPCVQPASSPPFPASNFHTHTSRNLIRKYPRKQTSPAINPPALCSFCQLARPSQHKQASHLHTSLPPSCCRSRPRMRLNSSSP